MKVLIAAAAVLAAALILLPGTTGAAVRASDGHCFVSVRAGGEWFTGRVTRSVRTSCPFARNVTRASLRFIIRHGGVGDGDFYVWASSPVTHRWYHAHCFANGDLYSSYGNHVDCRAGHGARVVYTGRAT